MFRYT